MRTICIDEMLVTLAMARWATPVRSGNPPASGGSRSRLRDGCRGTRLPAVESCGAAVACSALCIRPVSTRPATNPQRQ